MDKGLSRLVELLNARGASMEEMVRLLEEERASIVALQAERLQAAVEHKVQVVARMEELDDDCRKVIADEARARGLGEATLSPLLTGTPSPEKAELAGLQARLSTLAREIRDMIAANRLLLEPSWVTVGRSLAFFQSRLTVAETYGHSGSMVERSSGGILRKEI
ncbi:MAG TPA: flagellar protein FlgN [Geobacter anodireducens]|nr:flagellar protein FlgN [Geobacter anodireducens]